MKKYKNEEILCKTDDGREGRFTPNARRTAGGNERAGIHYAAS